MKQTIKPCYFASGTCINCDASERGVCEGWVCSPKRPWVGLTDEEIQATHDTYHKRMGPMEYAQAIEAKLKEKNNG